MIVVHGDRGQAVDGIRDHGARLAAELSRRSLEVDELALPIGRGRTAGGAGPLWRRFHRLRRSPRSSTLLVQYSPFCYGRRGFAPWLPAWLLAVRAGGAGPTVALMVHEPYVPMVSWRWALMGLWQRLQLAALRLGADVVLTSIEPWARSLRPRSPRRPTHHLPVGSNFPDRRGRRAAERGRLALGEGTLLVSCLGRRHPGWLGGYAVAAVNAIARSGRRLVLLNLGADAPRLDGLDPAVEVRTPGYLREDELAAKLAASDLFLAPLLDGVSTRRGSLMAALQHGLPVAGTAGPLTDALLRDAAPALCLAEVGDRERFAAAAARFAADPARRAVAATAARDLYEREFDWPVLAGKLLAALPER